MFDMLVQEYPTLEKSIVPLFRVRSILRNHTRNIFLTVLFLVFTYSVNATNYYVSNSGNDSHAGTSPESAWRTINKVNKSTFVPGDQILFKRGEVWREQLTVRNSGTSGNPITFGAYGTGDKPIIDGADVITGMTSYATNMWQKTAITTQPYTIWLNGTLGDLKASVVACTSEGDWFWGSNTLSVYSATDPSGNVEISQRDILIDLSFEGNITLKNLTVQHSNSVSLENDRGTIYMYGGSYLTVSGCTIQDNSLHGLHVINSSHILIDNNTLLRNGTDYLGKNIKITSLNVPMTDVTVSNNNSSYAGADGCMIYASTVNNRMTNVDIHGNTFNHNKASGCYSIKSDSVVIYNNTFDSNGDETAVGEDYGIGVESVDNIDVYNNTITNQLHNDGIQVWANTAETSLNVRIFRNYVSGIVDGDCIEVIPTQDGSMENTEIFSNVLVNASLQGLTISYSGTGTVNPVSIYNNTFYGNHDDIYKYDEVPVVLRNNIFSHSNVANVNAPISANLTISNNLWYNPGKNVLSYNGSTYTSATITNFEASAQNTDPLFTDAGNGDYTLQKGSPAIDAGTDVGLTLDILGKKIEGTPDIGACESRVTNTDTDKPTITGFTIPETSSSLVVPISSFTATDNISVSGFKITESATAPNAGDAGWTTGTPSSYIFSTEGAKTLYAWTKDAAGNISTSVSDQVVITLPDTTKPVNSSFIIPSTSTSLTVSILEFISTDDIGINGYFLTETSTVPDAESKNWISSVPASYTFSSPGTKTLYAWTKDAAGNISASISDQVIITLPDLYTSEDISICEGSSYEGWTSTGQYERVLTAASGADSIVTTNLYVNSVLYVSEDITIVEGESYQGWTTSGQYRRTLTASSGCDSIVTTNLTVVLNLSTQTIELREGWNIFSSYLKPLNNYVEVVMRELRESGQLILVEDENGNTHNQWTNNIGEMQETEGYKILVSSDCSLEIKGTLVNLPLDIPLKEGWNYISFPHAGSVNAMDVIQPLIDDGCLTKVQDERGNAIEPWWGKWFNGIGNFESGEGYMVLVKRDCVLHIKDSYKKSGLLSPGSSQTVHFKPVCDTNGSNHMNINMSGLNDANFQIGDEIAAFDGEICVGAVKLTQYHMANDAVSINASASDEGTQNGFIEGHSIELKGVSASFDELFPVQAKEFVGDMNYRPKSSVFILLKKKFESIEEFDSIEINMYPNPANEKVSLKFSSLPENGTKIIITDITGKLVIIHEAESLIEKLDIQSQASGVYLVKIVSGEDYAVKRLIIN